MTTEAYFALTSCLPTSGCFLGNIELINYHEGLDFR